MFSVQRIYPSFVSQGLYSHHPPLPHPLDSFPKSTPTMNEEPNKAEINKVQPN